MIYEAPWWRRWLHCVLSIFHKLFHNMVNNINMCSSPPTNSIRSEPSLPCSTSQQACATVGIDSSRLHLNVHGGPSQFDVDSEKLYYWLSMGKLRQFISNKKTTNSIGGCDCQFSYIDMFVVFHVVVTGAAIAIPIIIVFSVLLMSFY